MSTKSLLLLLSFAALFLGAAAQAHGEMKICHRERGRGPNSALRCLRSKSLDGKMKRRMKGKAGNHIQRWMNKVWLKFLVNKRKRKIKGRKKVSAMKRKNERRRGKEKSVKQRQRTGLAARRKKLRTRKKDKSPRKRKRKKRRQKKIKLSKIIHIHVRQPTIKKKKPSQKRVFWPKKRIEKKQMRKNQSAKSFLEK